MQGGALVLNGKLIDVMGDTLEQNSYIRDRFRLRRYIALFAVSCLGAMVMLVIVVVGWPTDQPARQLQTIVGFAGTLVAAMVTIIMGYGASVHLDDQHQVNAGGRPSGDLPRGQLPKSVVDAYTAAVHRADEYQANRVDPYHPPGKTVIKQSATGKNPTTIQAHLKTGYTNPHDHLTDKTK